MDRGERGGGLVRVKSACSAILSMQIKVPKKGKQYHTSAHNSYILWQKEIHIISYFSAGNSNRSY